MCKVTLKKNIDNLINQTRRELKMKKDIDHSSFMEYNCDKKINNLAQSIGDKYDRLSKFIYKKAWNQSSMTVDEFVSIILS